MAYGTQSAEIIASTRVEHSPRGAALRRAAARMRRDHGIPRTAPLIVDGGSDTLEWSPDSGPFIYATFVGSLSRGARHSYRLDLCRR